MKVVPGLWTSRFSLGGDLLNPSLTGDLDGRLTNSPSSEGSKHMTYRQIKTGLLCGHDNGRDNIGLRVPLI